MKTNSSQNLEEVKTKLTWIDPKYMGAAVMFGAVGAILVSALFGTKHSVTYYITADAKRKQAMFSLLGWGLVGLGFLLLVMGIMSIDGTSGPHPDKRLPAWAGLGLLVGLLAGVFVLAKFGSILSVKKVENGVLWVKGASPAFLYDHPAK